MTDRLGEVLAWIDAHGDAALRDQLGPRYGIRAGSTVGVPMREMTALAKDLGRDHELAAALWASGGYEARTVAALVDEPSAVTVEQMDRWAGDFDNWAICDTVCFRLFDRAPSAWGRVEVWAADQREFVRRGAFALLWSLALHDRQEPDARFVEALPVVAAAATDDRPLVNKAVIMAVRAIAKKRSGARDAVAALADDLVASDDRAAQRVGRAALRDLSG